MSHGQVFCPGHSRWPKSMRVGALCHLQRAFSAILHGELKRDSNLAAQPLPTWSLSHLLKHGDSSQSSERLSGWRTKSSHTWIYAAPISCRGKVCSDIKQSVSISVPETAGMMSGPHRGSGGNDQLISNYMGFTIRQLVYFGTLQ